MAAIAQNYPATRYTAPLPPPPDFTSKAERERLSAPALKAFCNIIERWSIRDEDARELLGGGSNGPYYQMKKSQEGRTLSADDLVRISYLIGIFKALHSLHAADLADRWVRLANSNRIFGGQTPPAFL